MTDRILKLGAMGDDVRALQLDLAKLGYPLKGTGYFGPATDVAVETFQTRAGLRADGEVGPITRKALATSVGAEKPVWPAPGSVAGISVDDEARRPLWLQAGLKLIGTKETPGTKDTKAILDWADEEGGAIEQQYTHDSIPWCALFANVCLTRAGLKGTETLWALDFNADAMKKRIGRRWPAVKLPDLAVGAFAPMTRKTATGIAGHIILVVGRDQHGNVMGLGGNQDDAVNIKPFARSRLNQGFWWPEGVSLPRLVGFSDLPIVKSNGKLSSAEA